MGGYLKACAAGMLLATVACGSQGPGGAAGRTSPGSKEILWAFESGGANESSPEVMGDALVVAAGSGTFYLLDRKSGSVRWSYDARQDSKEAGFRADPTVLGDVILAGTDGQGGQVYAFEAATGQVRWKHPGGVQTEVAGAGGNAYVVNPDGKLLCLDLKTGQEKWSFSGAQPTSTPAADDGHVYVGGGDGKIHALDAGTGQPAWETDLQSDITTSLMVHEGVVYVGTAPFRVVSLEAQTGAVVRKIALQAKPVQSLLIAQGSILAFLHSNDGEGEADTVISLNQQDGRIQWARKAPAEWVTVHPHVWRDMVLAGERGGELLAFGITDGVKRWAYRTNMSLRGIGVADDAFYLGSTEGTVHAVDPLKIPAIQGAQ